MPAPVINCCVVIAFAVGGAAGTTVGAAVGATLVGGGGAVISVPPVEVVVSGVAVADMGAAPVCRIGAIVSFPVGKVVMVVYVGDALPVYWVRSGCLGSVIRGVAEVAVGAAPVVVYSAAVAVAKEGSIYTDPVGGGGIIVACVCSC